MVRTHQSDASPPGIESGACPFVDRNHACCRARFSIGQLDHLMDTCFGNYHSCANHWQLRTRDASVANSSVPVIITLRRHTVHEQLRPTGS